MLLKASVATPSTSTASIGGSKAKKLRTASSALQRGIKYDCSLMYVL